MGSFPLKGMLLSLTTRINLIPVCLKPEQHFCFLSKHTEKCGLNISSQSWLVKLAGQTGGHGTEESLEFTGLRKDENETSLIFCEVCRGLLLGVKRWSPSYACGNTSHLLNAPQGQLTRGRMGCPGRDGSAGKEIREEGGDPFIHGAGAL